MNVIEWCRANDIWYLKIDLQIPEACIKEAQQVYDEGYFVEHRYGDGDGWCSAALHGWVGEEEKDTRNAWYHTKTPSGHGYDENKVKRRSPELEDIWPATTRCSEEFPHKLYRRCRFMLLKPDGTINAHNDSNEKRTSEGRKRNIAAAINLAFYQPDNCYLRRASTKEELPFENCTGFWFDNGVNHEALNSSNENRYHFIIHGGSNKDRERLMLRSLIKQYGKEVLKDIDAKLWRL